MSNEQGDQPASRTSYFDTMKASFTLSITIETPEVGVREPVFKVETTPTTTALDEISWVDLFHRSGVDPKRGTITVQQATDRWLTIQRSGNYDVLQAERLRNGLATIMMDMLERLIETGDTFPTVEEINGYATMAIRRGVTVFLNQKPDQAPRRGFINVAVAEKGAFGSKVVNDPSQFGIPSEVFERVSALHPGARLLTMFKSTELGGTGRMAITGVDEETGKVNLIVRATSNYAAFAAYFNAMLVDAMKTAISDRETTAIQGYRDELRDRSSRDDCNAAALEQAFELPRYVPTTRDN